MKKVLDKLRNQSTNASKYEIDVRESVTSEHFKFGKIVRHGFPYQPTCIAFDPVQKLLAIGNQTGSIRIFGQPGVDCHVKHDSGASVLQILFLINEGALISVCTDDTVHLWTFRQKRPEIVNSLQFQKEKLTCVHLPYLSKYLYVGSDRGNVHIVQIENFALSGYVINWNKAIDVSQKTHPGAVCHLSECPLDDSKLLIGYERGTVVLWDLKSRAADVRFQCEHTLRSVCWHFEGKQFMCAHPDGSLTTWLVKTPQKPTASVTPHLRTKPSAAGGTPSSSNGGGTREKCKPIYKVDWKSSKNGDDFVIFSGGLPYDETGQMPSVTVLRGKSTTVLEMEHSIVTFVTLCDSPYISEAQNPYAVAVLLQTDLVIVDLHTPGYPCFENPYPMDLHESPVTYCTYLADCPSDLIPALYSVGSKQKRQGFSEKNWPIKGGEWSATCRSYPEVVITGHADGSIKFWDASSNGLQVLYKLKCGKIFDKPGEGLPEDLDPFAVQRIALCPFSRLLAVAGQASHVTVYKFCRKETNAEVPVLEVPISYYEMNNESGDKMQLNKLPGITRQDSVGSHTSSVTSEGSTKEGFYPVKVKGAAQKRPVGYQAELVCLTPWLSRNSPEMITSLAVNSTYGLLAYGTEQGLAVTDIVQHVVILSIGTPNLYGSSDPYTRVPKSPAANNFDLDTPYSPTISDRYENAESPSGSRLATVFSTVSVNSASGGGGGSATGGSGMGQKSGSWATSNSKALQRGLERGKSQGRGAQGQAGIAGSRRPFLKAQSVAGCQQGGQQPDSPAALTNCHFAPPQQLQNNFKSQSTDKEKDLQRSRSSSASSQEVVTSEGVSFVGFMESSPRKGDPSMTPSLWIGTTQGSTLAWCIQLPQPGDQRLNEPVLIVPSGLVLKQRGVVLNIGFLDQNFQLLAPPAESWKDLSKDTDAYAKNRVLNGGKRQRVSPANSTENGSVAANGDCQFAVCVSENQLKFLSLPSQIAAFKTRIGSESTGPSVARAEVVTVAGMPVVLCYTSSCRLQAYSLPTLRNLYDFSLLPVPDLRVARTISFTQHGHGLYMCSPTEIQKFSYSSELCRDMGEMLGDIFLPKDMPEAPKQSFAIWNLFSNQSQQSLDRDELFGESKGSKSVARVITGGIDPLRASSGGAVNEVSKAKMLLLERGAKLGEVEDATANMMESARSYAEAGQEMVNRYKNKKWYQL